MVGYRSSSHKTGEPSSSFYNYISELVKRNGGISPTEEKNIRERYGKCALDLYSALTGTHLEPRKGLKVPILNPKPHYCSGLANENGFACPSKEEQIRVRYERDNPSRSEG